MEDTDYILLFERFIRGEVTESEKDLLRTWFSESASKDVIFAYYLKQWNEASTDLSAEIQYRMLDSIKSKIKEAEHTVEKQTLFFIPLIKRNLVRIAVAASVLCAVSFSTYYITRNSFLENNNDYVISVARGQKASVRLPDGSKVWLNSDSKLTYTNEYNLDSRKVKLEGEAYFEVAKDKNKRFVVSSNGIDIEALGTVFSVKSYPDDSLITTTLLEGKVKVGNEITQTILYPHEAISFNSFNHKFTRKSTINIETVAQWRNNQLAFSGESLGDIAVTLERMYNIDIVFTSEKARNYHFAGVIRNNSLSNVFEIISFTAPIQYKITNNVVEIQDDK